MFDPDKRITLSLKQLKEISDNTLYENMKSGILSTQEKNSYNQGVMDLADKLCQLK